MRFIVSGKVQGVFFRASTAREAQRLGLRGHALNLPDGRVEVLALGNGNAVAELGRWLHRGPPAARVDHVDSESAPAASFTHLVRFRTN
jgi:acylphosphatase